MPLVKRGGCVATRRLSEARLWAELRKLPLRFRRQTPIGRYIVDFVCHAAKLVVEVDGARHDLDEAQLHDHERDAWLTSVGYRVVRVGDTRAYEDAHAVAEEIATLLPRREKGRDEGARANVAGDALEARPLATAEDL